MLKQLVTLLVFLFVLHLGRLEVTEDVERIKNILVELIPFMKDIKSALNYQEANLTSFKESLHQLTIHLEEHKNHTTAELTQFQTSLNTTQSTLDKKLESLAASLSEHQLQTKDDYSQLQISLNATQSSLDSHTRKLNSKLDSFDRKLNESLAKYQLQTNDNLDQLQASFNITSSLHVKLEVLATSLFEHQAQTDEVFNQLQTSFNTTQYSLFSELNSKLDSLDKILNTSVIKQDDLDQLQTSLNTTQSSLDSLNAKLSSKQDAIMLNEVNSNLSQHHLQIKNDLNQLQTSLSNTQSSLNTKLEAFATNFSEHQSQMENSLDQLQASLNITQSFLITLNSSISINQLQTEEDFDQLQTSVTAAHSSLDTKLEALAVNLSQHQSWTHDNFDQLQTLLNTSQSSLDCHTTEFLAKNLEILNTSLSEHQRQTRNDFDQLQNSLNTTHFSPETKLEALAASLSKHQQQTEDDFNQLQTSLNTIQFSLDNLTYQLNDINDYVEQLTLYTCGGTGGWRRVVYLDMTDSTSTCPFGWKLTGYSKRTCGRASSQSRTCDSVTFPVTGGEYNKLCGRIKAYQWGSTDAFANYHNGHVTTIDEYYVDGVSLTHGSPRQHIWTFAAGLQENAEVIDQIYICPCDASINISVPSFVGEDYFCESAVNIGTWSLILYSDDPLWNGENCSPSSSCCSFNNPPYFIKELPSSTTDDIEARLCFREELDNENIAIELVELYVQ